jgi:hypothetical protein
MFETFLTLKALQVSDMREVLYQQHPLFAQNISLVAFYILRNMEPVTGAGL